MSDRSPRVRSYRFGYPFGASEARVPATLVYEMRKPDAEKGRATLRVGGGSGIAMRVARD